MEVNREEYSWTEKPVVGSSIMLMGGSVDSYGEAIDFNIYYEVGKHKESGKVAILPTAKNQRHDFINDLMKKSGKLN
jgi:hypothetical protein